MTEPDTTLVGALHEFHDPDYAQDWADRFVPTPARLHLFEMIHAQLLAHIPADGHVVELGIGPGYLAEFLLQRMPYITYCGVDFSKPMLEIAGQRLGEFADRISFMQKDLVDDDWDSDVARPTHAIVSTWALHDLGNPDNVFTVYRRSFQALGDKGVLLNGDFIKPDQAVQEYEGGRFEVARHLAALAGRGFAESKCLSLFEEELDNPTPAQNYACIQAMK